MRIGTVRYRVVAFAVALAAITYFDRVCISTLAPSIMRDLNLTQIEMSYVFSAFTLAYAAFEIPTAAWADRIGTRKVLARIVVWWSLFTMATAGAFNKPSLLAIRFLFGAGEAGAWPCAARTFSRWIPASERGRIQGVFFAGAHLAGGLTPLLVQQLAKHFDWRAIFLMFGALGFIWAAAWYWWVRDDPAEHPAVSQAELAHITEGRALPSAEPERWEYWMTLLRSPNLLPLCLQYVANTVAFYFCITWFHTYLSKARGFEAATLGLFAGLPLMSSVLGDLSGGAVTDRLSAKYGLKTGRAVLGSVAYVVAGIAMAAGAATASPIGSVLLISLSVASTMFTLGASWGVCIDIGREHSGVVSAAMNTAGQIGGILCPIVVAHIVDRTGNWSLPLYMMSGLFFIGAVCWLFVDPRQPIFGVAIGPRDAKV